MSTPSPCEKRELAHVIREHMNDLLARYHITDVQKRALRDIARCRTAEMGGHVDRCLDCGHERFAYNSCRNRHCPKCQATAQAEWVDRQAQHLLPVEYFHVVFTLPDSLSSLILANPHTGYDLLFQSASATIREVAANPKRLGAMPGFLMVLHTWGQTLTHHPHVHVVATGGGLSCDESGKLDTDPRWVKCKRGFFLPVKVLAEVFRGKYVDGLRKAHLTLRLPDPVLADPAAFHVFLKSLYRSKWVVYAKRPFGGPEQVLKYLARYTHRVAIGNSRIEQFSNGEVTFRYKDYADHHRSKLMTLDAVEFLRRFATHVLPRRFVKIRHYGLLSNRHRGERMSLCRRLLMVKPLEDSSPTAHGEPIELAPAWERCCEKCGSRRLECIPATGNTS